MTANPTRDALMKAREFIVCFLPTSSAKEVLSQIDSALAHEPGEDKEALALAAYWEREGEHLETAVAVGDNDTAEYASRARATAKFLRARAALGGRS